MQKQLFFVLFFSYNKFGLSIHSYV